MSDIIHNNCINLIEALLLQEEEEEENHVMKNI